MKKSLFLSELKQILTSKKLLIPIIAVLFIPILYAGMFLWSFWDPYDHLQDLPVAIVNEDTGASYEEESLSLGNDLINRLKENDQFQFHFVNKSEAYTDLKNQKYYMVIEIPKDFSSNATTLLTEQPELLQLKYTPNEGFNFLSAQIGESAINEIKAAISGEVTATYAETMFSKIGEMANGFENASDGSKNLEDGANKLIKGTNELKENLHVLASNAIVFQDGVSQAYAGTEDITKGMSELEDGIEQLTIAGNQLFGASKNIEEGASQLTGGITQTNDGLNEIAKKTPELITGTTKVKSGVSELQKQLPTQIASTIGEQLQENTQQMKAGLDELQAQLSPQLANGIANQIANQQAEQLQQLAGGLQQSGLDEQTINNIVKQMKEAAPTTEELQQKLYNSIDTGLEKGFETYKSGVNKQLAGATAGIEKDIENAINPSFNQLSSGVETIYQGEVSLQNGINQLIVGTDQLYEGSIHLSEGQINYVENMESFTDKLTEANNGVSELAIGSNQLNTGMKDLSNGSEQINTGAHQLADGSNQLATGSVDLYNGTAELHEKLNEAANKAGAVESNDNTYDMMGNPVTINKKEINHVPNYGTGFAPYFISLGLFVGALLITIVYPLRDPAIKPRNGFLWFIGKFGVIGIVGIIQALLVDIILLLSLGIEVQSIPLFIFVSIITSLTFMSIIQFLVTLFGDPGRFIAIIILILQLTTSAGTFPLELIPNALQPISAALPMTYSVQAFKAVISSGDYSFIWQNIGILAAYIVGAMTLTVTYLVVKHKRNTNISSQQQENVLEV
ncbi:YhgE/Pip domain-containing protein [Aquibacillus rhizosphaerae]|uniref:YhgE/Pip domain-containing protein n=1 Tax=Aquibacillus rhizosphaerae TaxID=3051431 RepID=A0ABT7L547_9BACI|nr:YhgE/Pip domain-containing protein [Aquibacillus sp. LR5S19]MDL4840989.1 YhgE/Pip domain-containing protein [Aquibacillus sp. LR5S19]